MKSVVKLKLIRDLLKKLSPDEIVSKMKGRLLKVHPFFGVMVVPTPVYFVPEDDTRIKTAATDGESIWFNIGFLSNMTIEEAQFVLAHEVLHMTNLHLPRVGARHPRRWNFATDHWINLTLHEQAQLYPDVFAFPDMPRIMGNPDSSLVMDARFQDWSPDAIYAQLAREDADKSKDDPDGDPKPGEGQEGLDGDLDYEGYESGNESQEEKAKRLEREMKNRVAQASNAGQRAGKMAGSINKWVSALMQPKVDWQTVLAAYLTMNPSDYEWTSPDRRFSEWDIVVPDLVGEHLDACAVIDTSGSISDEMIKNTIGEVYNIMRSVDRIQGTLIGHDHAVHDWIEFTDQDPPTGFTGGGGGTDFFCVFKEVEDRGYKPKVMIWFTDGYATFPEDPGYPVIFVLIDTSVNAPEWATSIHITSTDK